MALPWYKKQIANILTIIRLILTPIFLFYFAFHEHYILALILFIAASITDFFDGRLARKYHISSFGKFTDSLADKLLVGAALIGFAIKNGGFIPIWMVVVMLFREVLVTVLRSVFIARYGSVVPANIWGKIKANSQMLAIVLGIMLLSIDHYVKIKYLDGDYGIIFFMMCVPLVLTVASGIQFLHANRRALFGLFGTDYNPRQ